MSPPRERHASPLCTWAALGNAGCMAGLDVQAGAIFTVSDLLLSDGKKVDSEDTYLPPAELLARTNTMIDVTIDAATSVPLQ